MLFLYTLHTTSKDWYPVFLEREKMLSVWNNSSLCEEVPHWNGEPLDDWFKDFEQNKLYIGRAYFSNNRFDFLAGRHRTRWLLQQGHKEVPILMTSRSIVEAIEIGMFCSRAFDGMEIS